MLRFDVEQIQSRRASLSLFPFAFSRSLSRALDLCAISEFVIRTELFPVFGAGAMPLAQRASRSLSRRLRFLLLPAKSSWPHTLRDRGISALHSHTITASTHSAGLGVSRETSSNFGSRGLEVEESRGIYRSRTRELY